MQTNAERQAEALNRAESGQSFANYQAIISGMAAKGIAESDILPRVNVLTFDAWKAKGRVVCKGEHGVKVVTFIPVTRRDTATGETETFRKARSVAVFHVSQTKPLEH